MWSTEYLERNQLILTNSQCNMFGEHHSRLFEFELTFGLLGIYYNLSWDRIKENMRETIIQDLT